MPMDNADINVVGSLQGWHCTIGLFSLVAAVLALIGAIVLALMYSFIAATIVALIAVALIGAALDQFKRAKDLEPVGSL